MTKCNVEVQRPFAESVWKFPIMGIVEVIIEFKAHSKDRVRSLVIALPNIKETLTEFSTEIKCWSDLSRDFFISGFVQFLAKPPA